MTTARGVDLEIQFIDPPGELVEGERLRFRVLKKGLIGQGQSVEIHQLDFLFSPNPWGRVTATDDPYVGLLTVVELVEDEDVYAQPDYSIQAVLKASGATVLRPRRRSKIATRRARLELIFLYGYQGRFERYDPLGAKQPIDPERSFRLESKDQRIVVENGRIFLEADSLSGLYTRIECKLPDDEVVSLDLATLIESRAAWAPSEPTMHPRYEEKLAEQEAAEARPALVDMRVPTGVAAELAEHEQAEHIRGAESVVPLQFEFIDTPGDLLPDEEIRFQVRLDESFLAIRHLQFHFTPYVWASVDATADPRVGLLRVLDLPRGEDIYERPELGVEASLRAAGGQSVRSRREARLVPGQVEVELVFYRGHSGSYELFNPVTAARPVDPEESFLLSQERARITTRDAKLFLTCDRMADLPGLLDVTLPNGEQLQLDLQTRIETGAIWNKEQDQPTAVSRPMQRPAPVTPGEEPEGPELRALRERIRQLKNFINSFQSRRAQPDETTTKRIKDRISARVKQTRDALRSYEGKAQRELLRAFQNALESIPDYLRAKGGEVAEAEAEVKAAEAEAKAEASAEQG